MIAVSSEEIDAILAEVEERLLALARPLDRPVERQAPSLAMLALGHRARTMFCGFVTLYFSEASAAATSLMRTGVGINLTLRFITANPELHAELWAAEAERQSLALLREFGQDGDLVARHGAVDLDAPWVTEREEYIAATRERALAEEVPGITKRGAIMPSMKTIAEGLNDPGAREAYRLAYRSLSNDVHAAARAFTSDHFLDGTSGITFADVPASRGERALNASIFASTISILSGPFDLEAAEEADTIRNALLQTIVAADA